MGVTICVAVKGWLEFSIIAKLYVYFPFEKSNEKDIQSPLVSRLEKLGLRFYNIFVAMIRFSTILKLDIHV